MKLLPLLSENVITRDQEIDVIYVWDIFCWDNKYYIKNDIIQGFIIHIGDFLNYQALMNVLTFRKMHIM